MMVVESAVQHVGPKPLTGDQLGWDLMTVIYMIYMIFILIKPFSDPLCPVDEGILILEETTHIRIEYFIIR